MNAGSRPVTALTWRQVNAWRLWQHCLSQRLERRRLVEAVTRTGGIQAQVMSAAELALWARVIGLSPQDVRSTLWQDRTLVKTWAMRATLHLISASDLPLYVAARSVYEGRNWPYYFSYHGISQPLYEAFLTAVPQILGNEPMTREQLAAAVAEQTGSAALRSLILDKGWGTPLKPSAWGRTSPSFDQAPGSANGSGSSRTRRCRRLPAGTFEPMARRRPRTSHAGGGAGKGSPSRESSSSRWMMSLSQLR
jgi:hypothetical protein